MQYMLLIYGNEAEEAALPQAQRDAEMKEYFALTEVAKQRGVEITDGDALHSVTTAKTVRVRNGKIEKIDGPFAETKEQLGGFYTLKADSLDKALEIAALIPGARHGSIEVRPVVDFSQG
ncbi:MAG: YciI family protein [Anaerolineae bacterium]